MTAKAQPVYLVATGEVFEGQETYTRHDTQPPLSDAEVLYTRRPQPLSAVALLVDKHAALLEENPYCYFELAYTRPTGWMAWLCSHPKETHPDRKVLARGQGDTPDEAAADALKELGIGIDLTGSAS